MPSRLRRRRQAEQFGPLERPRARPRGFAVRLRGRLEARAHLAFEIKEGAHRVLGRAPVRRFAKDVVEDLERQRSGVAGHERLGEEILEVELALPGEAPEVPRPLQHVHDQQRRIGQLHEEQLVARNARDAGRIVAQRQRVKAVEDQAEVRMIGALDDRPRLTVAVDRPSPGQRLVADAQVAPCRTLGQFK